MSRWFGEGAELGNPEISWEKEMHMRVKAHESPVWKYKTVTLSKVVLPSVFLAEGMKHEEETYILHCFEKRRLNKKNEIFELERLAFEADHISIYKGGEEFFASVEAKNLKLPSKEELNFTTEMWLSRLKIHLAKALFGFSDLQECLIFSLASESKFCLHFRRLIFSLYGEYPCSKKIKELSVNKIMNDLKESDPLVPKLRFWGG